MQLAVGGAPLPAAVIRPLRAHLPEGHHSRCLANRAIALAGYSRSANICTLHRRRRRDSRPAIVSPTAQLPRPRLGAAGSALTPARGSPSDPAAAADAAAGSAAVAASAGTMIQEIDPPAEEEVDTAEPSMADDPAWADVRPLDLSDPPRPVVSIQVIMKFAWPLNPGGFGQWACVYLAYRFLSGHCQPSLRLAGGYISLHPPGEGWCMSG